MRSTPLYRRTARFGRRQLRRLEAMAPWSRATLGLVLLIAVAVFDTASGRQISVSMFYVLPVALAAWYDGVPAGLFSAVVCAATWGGINLFEDPPASPAVPVWNAAARLGFFAVVSLVLAAVRRTYDREARLSRTDPLTGLLNMRGFRESAEVEIARARRYRSPLSCLLVDLDDFKQVNDTRGHAEGDRLLEEVGRILPRQLRAPDLVARLGGDEFVVLLPETAAAAASVVAEKLLRAVGHLADAHAWGIGASVGWGTWTGPPPRLDEMLATVDRKMYEAKRAGKGSAVGGLADQVSATSGVPVA